MLVKRQRPVRDAIGAVSNTIGAGARVINTLVDVAELSMINIKEDIILDNYEEETERLVRRAQLEVQRAELLAPTAPATEG